MTLRNSKRAREGTPDGGRFGYEVLDRDQARPGQEWEITQTSIDPRVR